MSGLGLKKQVSVIIVPNPINRFLEKIHCLNLISRTQRLLEEFYNERMLLNITFNGISVIAPSTSTFTRCD